MHALLLFSPLLCNGLFFPFIFCFVLFLSFGQPRRPDWSTQMLKLESTAKTIPTLTKKIEQYKNQVRGKLTPLVTVCNVNGNISTVVSGLAFGDGH